MRIVQVECSKHDIKFLELKYTIPQSASSSQQYLEVYGDQVVDYIGYADDLAMVFDSIANLIKGLEILNNIFKKFGLIINETKTKKMLLNFVIEFIEFQRNRRKLPQTIAKLNNFEIENVKIFQYLGGKISFNQQNTGDDEITCRIDMAETAYHKHQKISKS